MRDGHSGIVTIMLRWNKTDPFGFSTKLYVGKTEDAICPVYPPIKTVHVPLSRVILTPTSGHHALSVRTLPAIVLRIGVASVAAKASLGTWTVLIGG